MLTDYEREKASTAYLVFAVNDVLLEEPAKSRRKHAFLLHICFSHNMLYAVRLMKDCVVVCKV
jgi:hypothetical protein